MHAAVKLQVTIPRNRRVQLPEDLPEGRAEIIVLYPEAARATERTAPEAAQVLPKTSAPRRSTSRRSTKSSPPMDYFARLVARQPHPLSDAASSALDEANRGDR